jgi:hypothetical protein
MALCRSKDTSKGRDVSKATRISSSVSSGPRIEVLRNCYNIQHDLSVTVSFDIYATVSQNTKNTMPL